MVRRTVTSIAVVSLAMVSAPRAQNNTLVFVGARIVDGTGAAPIAAGVIVSVNGRITAVGPVGSVAIPSGAERIDVNSRTILPGLVNTHGHVASPTRENILRQLARYARYGVTSVLTLGGEGGEGVALRREPAAGRARIFVADQSIAVQTAEAAAAAVDAIAAKHVDWLKIRIDDNLGSTPKMPKAAWKAVIDRGRDKKLPVAAHIFYLDDAKDAVREGVAMIAHSVRDLPVDDEFIALMRARNVCYVPTLMREVQAFVYESTPSFFSDPFFLRDVDVPTVEQLKEPARQEQVRKSTTAKRYRTALEVASANLKRLADAGALVAMGTDSGLTGRFEGYFEHMELELMVKAGLTPMQAIAAATDAAARCIRQQGQVGRLAAGAAADLAIFREDPSRDIRATRSLESVWIAGRRID